MSVLLILLKLLDVLLPESLYVQHLQGIVKVGYKNKREFIIHINLMSYPMLIY